ncbi:MAG: SPOR domain-containing protein [Panacagrimonas sp.]
MQTGGDGRVELAVNGAATLFVGSDAEFLLHSFEASVVRVRLSQGEMHIDARAVPGGNSRDVRLNLGELRVRIAGAEAWAQQTAAVTQVCMVSAGYVEVKRGEQLSRIDMPGQCLRLSNAKSAWTVVPPNVLTERILLTAVTVDPADAADAADAAEVGWAPEPPVSLKPETVAKPESATPEPGAVPADEHREPAPAGPVSTAAAESSPESAPEPAPEQSAQAEPPEPARPTVAERRAKPQKQPPADPVVPPKTAAAPVAKADSGNAAWSIVLASLSTRQAAETEVARLKAQGVHQAEVRAYQNGKGAGFRVGTGRYASRAQADAALAKFRSRYPKLSGWLARY